MQPLPRSQVQNGVELIQASKKGLTIDPIGSTATQAEEASLVRVCVLACLRALVRVSNRSPLVSIQTESLCIDPHLIVLRARRHNHTSMHECKHVFMCVCKHVCMCVCMHAHMYLCEYTYMYASMHACMHACVYERMSVLTCILSQTHANTQLVRNLKETFPGKSSSTIILHVECSTPGARIRYTIDGSTPNAASPEYTDGITLGVPADGSQARYVVKAFATAAGMAPSDVADAGQFLVQAQAKDPVFTPNTRGPFENKVEVSLTSETPGAVIHYTTDLSQPTSSSAVYDEAKAGPVVLTSTGMIVKAIAFAYRMDASHVTESVAYIIQASAPTVKPYGGVFDDSVNVTLESVTQDAAIYYSVDGTDPDVTSTVYHGPFAIHQTDTVIKAIAVHSQLVNSNISSSPTFVIKASPPQLTSDSDVFTEDAKISISTATPGTKIHFTLDGTDPTLDSPVATSPLSITETGHILKVMVAKPGMTPSDVITFGDGSPLVIKSVPPILSPDGGLFHKDEPIVISCPLLSNCKMYYTLDGTEPTESSPLYTGTIDIKSTNTRVKAVSVMPGKAPSDVVTSAPFILEPYKPQFRLDGDLESEEKVVHHDPDSTFTDKVVKEKEEDFAGTVVIHLRSRTPAARVHYTTNGDMPTEQSPVYIAGHPLALSIHGLQDNHVIVDRDSSIVIKAIAVQAGMSPSKVVVSDVIDILSRISAPEIEPDGGTFGSHVVVRLRSFTAGSKIVYTLDSSEPTKLSTVYAAPFILSTIGITTVKAMCTKAGFTDSEVVSAKFVIQEQVATPVFHPTHGTFFDSFTLNISCATKGAKIRYTINGYEPNAGDSEFIDGVVLGLAYGGEEAAYVVRAVGMMVHSPHGTSGSAERLAMSNSEVGVSGRYIIKPSVVVPVNKSDMVQFVESSSAAGNGGKNEHDGCVHKRDGRGRPGVLGYYDPDCYMKEVCVPGESSYLVIR